MAQAAEMDERLARLEAALAAAAAALDRPEPEDLGPALEAARGDLGVAQERIEALERRLDEAERRAEAAEEAAAASRDAADLAAQGGAEGVRMRAAIEALTATSAQLRAQQEDAGDAALMAELEALRAARAMDLAEMQTLLALLEPMLETPKEDEHA